MAYDDEQFAARIRTALGDEPDLTEQRMFGGLGFMLAGHMVVAASGQGGLLVRVDPADSDRLVDTTNARPMEMRGPGDAWLAPRRRRRRPHVAPAHDVGEAGDDVRAHAAAQALRSRALEL